MSVPNQKKILIQKSLCDENHPYVTIDVEAMRKAAQELSEDAFKLWCYLAATSSVQRENF